MGFIETVRADLVKVGPKGYEHGWIYVGPQAAGARILHPTHGAGTLTRAGKRTTGVQFDSGHHAAFEHQPGPRKRGAAHFTERTPTPTRGRRTPARPAVGSYTDEDLADHFHELSSADRLDEPRTREVLAEMERRDAAVTPQQRHIDALIAKGVPYRDAYAEAHNLDPDELDKQERAALIDAARRAGETRTQTLRRLYAEHVHHQYLAAENASRGHLLNKRGQAAGIDPMTLFSGPTNRARAYASEELKRFWERNRRSTWTQFRDETAGGFRERAAARASRSRGNERDFGV